MALANVVLNDGQGTPVAHTFEYTGAGSNGRVIRTDMAANPETPLTMTLAHTERVRNGVKEKSHLVRFDKGILDADGVTLHNANIRVMIDVPNPVQSDALADDLSAFVRNFLSSANARAILKGSVL